MSIDNPFDQVEALIASDERQQLPEPVEAFLKAAAKLPGAGPFVALVRYESEKQRFENAELMLRTAWEELKRVSATLNDFLKDPARHDAVRRLILDATRKAEDLRDRRRVERIGKILAHALTLSMSNFDKAEEMMRVARDLSDADVVALGYLYDTQFQASDNTGWQVDVDATNRIWRENPPKIPGTFLPGEQDSLFLKLQGLGLATAVERRNTQHDPNVRLFKLLPKGADFVHYIEGAVREEVASERSNMAKSWADIKKPPSVYVTYQREKATTLTADEMDEVENEAKRVFPQEGWKRVRLSERDLFALENITGDGWIARQ